MTEQVKETPVPALQLILNDLAVSQADFARAVGLSRSAAGRLVKDSRWPARAAALHTRLAAWLRGSGAQPMHWALARDAGLFANPAPVLAAAGAAQEQQGPAGQPPGRAYLSKPATPEVCQPTENEMLLQLTPLKPEARKHFGLARSPFTDDVSGRDDVFASPATRMVRAALMDAALHQGFIAIVGESGSGKTTLREDLEQRLVDEGRPVVVIKPYTLAMEQNDVKGKQMKSGQIAEAIAHALAPSVQMKSSPEARFRQVHELLRDSARAGTRHLLLIEEAHRMPLATLRHLKGWMELKDGMRRLLGVCLIGQTELGDRLAEPQREIREVVQRCEKVTMEPLDEHLEAYLAHKFARVGADVAGVMAPDAYDALRARLVQTPRNGQARDAFSICYPLAVNNWMARCMNAAAGAGWPKVDAQCVLGS